MDLDHGIEADMNSLPQLTTIRRNGPPAEAKVTETSKPTDSAAASLTETTWATAQTKVTHLDVPGLSVEAKKCLTGLLEAGILTTEDVPRFIDKLGESVRQLHTTEQVLDALVAKKLLTEYVTTRLNAGMSHGLVYGSYRVLDRLSSGSIGIVFKGEHVHLKREVAIKAMSLEEHISKDLVSRFFSEVRILTKVQHPNVVTIYDAGRLLLGGPGQAGMAFLVMELLAGGDLENHVYAHGLPNVATVCSWMRQIALGLRACHAEGFIHRDVKPSNILLSKTNEAKLTDFGLARDFASTRTVQKSLLGSLEFLAPEQLSDAPTANEPADVYGLGCTFFWLLTGQLPYPQQKTTTEAIALIRSGKSRKLREVREDLPESLEKLIGKMLAPSPADRPTTDRIAAELAAFDALYSGAVSEADRTRANISHLESIQRSTQQQLELARNATLSALALAAARRPGESVAHQNRVAAFTHLLASALGSEVDWIMYADARNVSELCRIVPLHDVGLVGVSDDLLTGSLKRSASEQFSYEQHTIIGEKLLDDLANEHGDSLPFLRSARAVVRHHHERWDGNGFPDKLKEDAIPPSARIAAVALAYDTERTRGQSHADAVAQIRGESGTAFDPAVVNAFVQVEKDCERIYGLGIS